MELERSELTSFRDATNIVDKGKAIVHFKKEMTEYAQRIEAEYARLLSLGKNSLATAFASVSASEAGRYATVDWAKPYGFISIPSLGALYCHMEAQSLPYVYVNDVSLFTKRQVLIFASSNQHAQPGLPEMGVSYQALQTNAIKDKICTLQVMPLATDYVKTLTGIGTDDQETPQATEESAPGEPVKAIGETAGEPSPAPEKETAPKRGPQMLGNGYKLLRDMRLGEAKRYFATVERNSHMADECVTLIKSKRLIDEIAKGANGDMTEAQKQTIRQIVTLFAEYGIEYVPLRQVAEKYIND